jgi:hypothetical protein
MPLTYSSVKGLQGKENPGGIGSFVWYSPTSRFTTIQQPANMATATTPADLAKVTANHAFPANTGFLKFYCTQQKGEGSFTNSAEVDASGGFYEVMLFVPGTDATTEGLLRMMKGDDLIFIIPMADSVNHQVGTGGFPAKLQEYKFGTAQNASGVRGTEVKIRAFQLGSILYEGTITPDPNA